jgi:hypothetical protein
MAVTTIDTNNKLSVGAGVLASSSLGPTESAGLFVFSSNWTLIDGIRMALNYETLHYLRVGPSDARRAIAATPFSRYG